MAPNTSWFWKLPPFSYIQHMRADWKQTVTGGLCESEPPGDECIRYIGSRGPKGNVWAMVRAERDPLPFGRNGEIPAWTLLWEEGWEPLLRELDAPAMERLRYLRSAVLAEFRDLHGPTAHDRRVAFVGLSRNPGQMYSSHFLRVQRSGPLAYEYLRAMLQNFYSVEMIDVFSSWDADRPDEAKRQAMNVPWNIDEVGLDVLTILHTKLAMQIARGQLGALVLRFERPWYTLRRLSWISEWTQPRGGPDAYWAFLADVLLLEGGPAFRPEDVGWVTPLGVLGHLANWFLTVSEEGFDPKTMAIKAIEYEFGDEPYAFDREYTTALFENLQDEAPSKFLSRAERERVMEDNVRRELAEQSIPREIVERVVHVVRTMPAFVQMTKGQLKPASREKRLIVPSRRENPVVPVAQTIVAGNMLLNAVRAAGNALTGRTANPGLGGSAWAEARREAHVNMSADELAAWALDPRARLASTHVGLRSLAVLGGWARRGFDEPTEEEARTLDEAQRFNARHLASKPLLGKPVDDYGMSRREIALRNWGHDVRKPDSPAHAAWRRWARRWRVAT